MGEAKRRGSYQQRKEQAIIKKKDAEFANVLRTGRRDTPKVAKLPLAVAIALASNIKL